jgi:predicted molibdopterin-dependent oxidoreductase YjgC
VTQHHRRRSGDKLWQRRDDQQHPEIRDADCILITGSNTAEAHPVISYEVVRAVKKGPA